MHVTQSAKTHEPTGDKQHVSYGQDYYYQCSCGYSGRFLMRKEKAKKLAEYHEEQCINNGETTVKVR